MRAALDHNEPKQTFGQRSGAVLSKSPRSGVSCFRLTVN